MNETKQSFRKISDVKSSVVHINRQLQVLDKWKVKSGEHSKRAKCRYAASSLYPMLLITVVTLMLTFSILTQAMSGNTDENLVVISVIWIHVWICSAPVAILGWIVHWNYWEWSWKWLTSLRACTAHRAIKKLFCNCCLLFPGWIPIVTWWFWTSKVQPENAFQFWMVPCWNKELESAESLLQSSYQRGCCQTTVGPGALVLSFSRASLWPLVFIFMAMSN